MNYKEEVRFLASLLANPSRLSSLTKDVSQYDFRDINLYAIYKTAIDFLADGREPSLQEIRFRLKDNPVYTSYLDEIEREELITRDLQAAYNEMSERSQHARLYRHTVNLMKEVKQEDLDVDRCISEFEATLTNIRLSSGTEIEKISSIVGGVSKGLNKRVQHYKQAGKMFVPIPTGIEKLDYYTGGLTLKNTWLLGAASSDGKTQLGVQIAQNILSMGEMVYWFQCEDSKENLIERLLSTRNRIKIKDIRSGALTDNQLKVLNSDLQKMRQEDNLLIEENTTDIDVIVNKVKLAKLKFSELKVIVVDYIGLLSDSSRVFGTREAEISFISKKLVALAKSSNVAILVLTQLNTSPDDRSWGIPVRLNDVRDSKATGHDATVAIFIHHPLKYGMKSRSNHPDEDSAKRYWAERNRTKYSFLIIAKNRYGENGRIIEMTNHADVMRFDEGKPKDCPFDVKDFVT